MDIFGIDISHIVDLGTQVALAGAFQSVDLTGDDVFEYLIGIAIVVF